MLYTAKHVINLNALSVIIRCSVESFNIWRLVLHEAVRIITDTLLELCFFEALEEMLRESQDIQDNNVSFDSTQRLK